MSIVTTDSVHYENLASKIREKTGLTTKYKPVEMPSGVDAVYEAGKKAEYDAFWDAFQRNGERTEYFGAFDYFNRDGFYPKYDIKLKGSSGGGYAFRVFPDSSSAYPPAEDFDLVARLNECGVTIDTSQATALTQTFYFSCVSTIPTLDLRGITGTLAETFNACSRLHTIEKLILSDNGTQVFGNTVFNGCQKLQNITFEGVIGNSINFQWSTVLSKASIQNIIGALSTTATGKTLTLSKTAVNNAFTTDEWTALANTRTNWTISLV